MKRVALSSLIQTAPAWIRQGLSADDARLRERAADALAAMIIDKGQLSEDAVLTESGR
jgi:Zn-dependent protease with chaperone function